MKTDSINITQITQEKTQKPNANDFEDLTDDWDFIQQSSSRMELIDRSDDGEPDDLLTFEKN
ncbi:MAG: hypothetical protein HKP24_11210 [Croceitalea sp.]|nr:hypothetical protein [Croceitalea sp.]